ncbi:hypothetical protein FSARC_10865 [Fusarium sarcochroum]|uniref:Uncharacterized protein n=1 Tax=Fusarium sarcochroum TaxID=1208366 RepID=A0A8H4X2X9_9HYPO|nr:hypothetical protein FSARC_10865 [Fusarium sarcochroum]
MADSKKLATIPASNTSGPPEVISVGLWRMGTASMAAAYNTIGLRPHHSLDLYDNPDEWALWEKAADATFRGVNPSNAAVSTFTRQQWDEIYGQYGAITEHGAAFAEQLIQAYPEAKVVICRRDFDKWWPSFRDGVLYPVYSYQGTFLMYCVLPILGNRAVMAMRKTLSGFFGGDSLPEIEKNAKTVYEDYFETIRELVPPERRLEYKLGDGWEPLCNFLGKDIPDVEFPHINEAKALKEMQQREAQRVQNEAWEKLKSWRPW